MKKNGRDKNEREKNKKKVKEGHDFMQHPTVIYLVNSISNCVRIRYCVNNLNLLILNK
jgi:adenylylsulfate kinase-like enzyme